MDFTLDDEQRALRDAVRDMLGRSGPTDTVGPAAHDPARWQELAEMGLLALPYGSDLDGAGPVEVMVVARELGRARARTAYVDTLLAGHVLAATGQDQLLVDVAEGSALVVPALTEPGRAWGAPPTVSTEGGALSGVKGPVAYADAATHAVVSTVSGLFLVEKPPVDGGRLVLEATAATPLADDPAVLQAALAQATVALCAEALGAMDTALDLTVGYLKTRRQFGVPLMTFQALTHRAADLYVQRELAVSAVEYAAMALADPPYDPLVASRTAVVIGKAGRLIGQEAIQLHGGIGMTAEYAVGHLAARLTAIEHTWGDTRFHLARLGREVSAYRAVEIL